MYLFWTLTINIYQQRLGLEFLNYIVLLLLCVLCVFASLRWFLSFSDLVNCQFRSGIFFDLRQPRCYTP